MKSIYYSPYNLDIFLYKDPIEFANSSYKPFGEIPKGAIYDSDDTMCTGFIVKGEYKELHLYIEENCSKKEIFELLAHEIGHLQPKISINLNDEKKANMYEIFMGHVFSIYELIFHLF